MPIPFILAGAAALAGGFGHYKAKKMNEEAVRNMEAAEDLFNSTKNRLFNSQKSMENSLISLGENKKTVLDTSMEQFISSYGKIKNVNLEVRQNFFEIPNYTINHDEMRQLKEISTTLNKMPIATGAATGAVIGLAASGALPIVGTLAGMAGTSILAGEFALAGSLASSALSFGAALTPLSVVAAPVVLFSGISSAIKADENLEKARVAYAEASSKAAEMEVSITLCNAISDKSKMFNNLLNELNKLFSKSTPLLAGLVKKHTGFFKGNMVSVEKLSEEEIKLIAVTRSLAGAMKAVIDTPMLTEKGNISPDFESTYNKIENDLLIFDKQVKEVESSNLNIKPRALPKQKTQKNKESFSLVKFNSEVGRNWFGLIIALAVGYFTYLKGLTYYKNLYYNEKGMAIGLGVLAFSFVSLIFINNNTNSLLFKAIKNISYFVLSAIATFIFFILLPIIDIEYFWWIGIGGLFIFGGILGHIGTLNKNIGSIRQLFQSIIAYVTFAFMLLLIFKGLVTWTNFSLKTLSYIITGIYGLFSLGIAFGEGFPQESNK
ncbi:hypothetical protein KSU09_04175 [Fusobacterium nucleatum]|uniref:hypothetical protein n=1 Tax=Fusobacterium nucleatum TaxID=851 RepID=UPI0030D09FA0